MGQSVTINFTDICSFSDCDEKLVSEKHMYHSKVLNVIWATSQDLFTSGPDGHLVSVWTAPYENHAHPVEDMGRKFFYRKRVLC